MTVNSNQVTVYPNPVNNKLSLKFSKGEEISSVIIYDALGKELINTKEKEIDVSVLQNGVYLIQVSTKSTIYNAKFIKE